MITRFCSHNHGKLLPILAILTATGMWGSTFALQKDMFDRINPVDFLGLRFVVAGVVSIIIFRKHLTRATPRMWKHGIVLGLLYAIAQEVQTYGLSLSSAAVTGFLTGLYVVLTPILTLILFKLKQPLKLWFAVALSALGLAVMSLNGVGFGFGEAVVLGAALLYSVHVVAIERFVNGSDPITLCAIQMITLAVVCGICALPNGIALPSGEHAAADWISILYQALFSGIGSLLLQTWAQSRISATQAAVVMTSEPVWSALFAVLLIHESISIRTAIGGALIVVAMLLSQIDLPQFSFSDVRSMLARRAVGMRR